MSLFEDAHAWRERLVEAYTKELLRNPPVRSVSEEGEPDPERRERNARVIARKDVGRVMRAAYGNLSGEQIEAVGKLYWGEKP